MLFAFCSLDSYFVRDFNCCLLLPQSIFKSIEIYFFKNSFFLKDHNAIENFNFQKNEFYSEKASCTNFYLNKKNLANFQLAQWDRV